MSAKSINLSRFSKFASRKLNSNQRLQMSTEHGSKPNILKSFVDVKKTSACLVPFDAVHVPNSVEVKSLIWEYNGCPMLIVLDIAKQVDVALLAQHCGATVEDISLASRERAVQLGGMR
jgi:prolyl-tRNA editing enzyme YbaK/EbsC (Cys-tRNA(Pro) deacylase)